MTSKRTQALIDAMDSDSLAHYGVKGMKRDKSKLKTDIDELKTPEPRKGPTLKEIIEADQKHKEFRKKNPAPDAFNDNVKISAKIEKTDQPNRRHVVLKPLEDQTKKKKQGSSTSTARPFLKHSAIEELLGMDVDDNSMAHYGVIGMKWGIRNDNRVGKRQSRKEKKLDARKANVKKAQVSRSRGNNKLAQNPQNRRMSDAELTKIINRIRLENAYMDLTKVPAIPPAEKSRFQKALSDVAFSVGTGVATDLGKAILKQALGVQFNKSVSSPYRIKLNDVKKVLDNA